MKRKACIAAILVGLSSLLSPADATSSAGTPAELVASYNSLADIILGAKEAEDHLVRSILASTYGHAEDAFARARTEIGAGGDARVAVESLAALVAQLGNEGDAAVAAVRKRLLEGGHHHNAAGEQQGEYEEGYVVVTRAAKKVFIDCATRIGKLAAKPDADALAKQWKTVQTQYGELAGGE